MKVRAVMTKDVKSVGPRNTLAEAGRIMADHDCGALPVVDPDRRVVGVVTDRDVCLAVTARSRPPLETTVREAMSIRVYSCGADDDVGAALEVMRDHQVRRLPVVDDKGRLVGILSMDDVVLQASPAKIVSPREVTHGEAIGTLKAIYRSRPVRRPALFPG